MFLPPKQKTIVVAASLFAALVVLGQSVQGQDAEFDRRLAAMQQARNRATQPIMQSGMASPPATQAPQGTRVATRVDSRNVTRPNSSMTMANSRRQGIQPASAQMTRVTTAPPQMRVAARPRNSRLGRFVPQHMRTAQVMDGTIIDSGSPVIGSDMMVSGNLLSSQNTIINSPIVDGQVVTQPYVEGEMMVDGCSDGSCGGCSTCGEVGGYFDDCCGRGGCPDGQPCWLNGLGGVLQKAEFFSGFTSFRSALFDSPITSDNSLVNDCSHGYYGGVNVGLPLCRLTCGAFSGQFGVRTVNTNFNGNAFTEDDRNQLFFTAGFYRRVDYGLQLGVVADVLREEWYANSDLVQIRGDIGYVWPAGTTFGFKFATNVQDDVVAGTFNGQAFTGQGVSTDDNYRFYLRHDAKAGGWGELFAGWSETNQGIIGMDFDMPITDRVAFEAGFTYYLNDDGVPANAGLLGGQQGQAYNTYIGLAFRPRGRSWYRSYDRPLFDVADNGSMLTIRN